MKEMFAYCSSLTSLDLSSFNTSKVTTMQRMFRECKSLANLNIGNFDTSNVMKMGSMFSNCESLTTLDLSSFNTANVTNMNWMFSDGNDENHGCSQLITIFVSDEWSTQSVEQGEGMFGGCPNLVGGSGTKWDETHTDYTYARIDGGMSNPCYLTYKENSSIKNLKAIGDGNTDLYNLNGVKLHGSHTKGVYITNGRKVVIKLK